ncbi:MAG: hypothetical protein V9F01_15535 [Chitinophagaceae bacterium]
MHFAISISSPELLNLSGQQQQRVIFIGNSNATLSTLRFMSVSNEQAIAATFFVTTGVSHWYVIFGLLHGGAVAAHFATKLAGKLLRKTMMIVVGVMAMVWCSGVRIKSLF